MLAISKSSSSPQRSQRRTRGNPPLISLFEIYSLCLGLVQLEDLTTPFFYNAFVMTPKSLLPAFLDGMTEKISRRLNILYEAVVSLQLVVQTGWLGEIWVIIFKSSSLSPWDTQKLFRAHSQSMFRWHRSEAHGIPSWTSGPIMHHLQIFRDSVSDFEHFWPYIYFPAQGSTTLFAQKN